MNWTPSVDFDLRAYGPQRIAAVVQVLADEGVAPDSVLQGSTLDAAALGNPNTRVSYRQQIAVFRNALRLTRDPTLAFRAGARMHVTAYGMWGYALLSSRFMNDVLELAVKYRGVIGPLAALTYDVRENIGTARLQVLLTSDANDELYRFAIEFTLAAHVTLGRDLYGDRFGPTAIHVTYAAPAHAAAYRSELGCPAQFDSSDNIITYDDSLWRKLTPIMHNPATHMMARQTCERLSLEIDRPGDVGTKLKRTIIEHMPHGVPSMDAIAGALSMHPRTLRRQLRDEGTTYRHILADVRCKLALEYLRQTDLNTEEIATRLGYSEAANFRHAFVRWTGKNPSDCRSR